MSGRESRCAMQLRFEQRDELAAWHVCARPGFAQPADRLCKIGSRIEIAQPQLEIASREMLSYVCHARVTKVRRERFGIVSGKREPALRSRRRGTVERGTENAIFHKPSLSCQGIVNQRRIASVFDRALSSIVLKRWCLGPSHRMINAARLVPVDPPDVPRRTAAANIHTMHHRRPALRDTHVTIPSNVRPDERLHA